MIVIPYSEKSIMMTYKQFVMKEENMAGDGGVFGSAASMGHGGDVGNSDFYAPGVAYLPKPLFKAKGKKGKNKILVQRRNTFKYF